MPPGWHNFFINLTKSTVMNRKRFVLPVLALLFVAAVALTKCESAGSKAGSQDSTSTHINGPAPDNNSANNPSMADTAFQKDSTHRKKDSVR
jgi:hypothetical protein